MSFDHETMGRAFSGPGADTRQWISIGIVDADTPGARSVELTEEGPAVTVTLQPSGTTVRARVAMRLSGVGEGEWSPLIDGDEVLVALPEGMESAFPVIIGRLSNGIDKFPTNVAGVDVTTNAVAFAKQRPAMLIETDSGYLIRSSATGAQIGIDLAGQVVIGGGGGGQLFLSDDALGFVGGSTAVQAYPAKNQVVLRAGDAQLEIGSATKLSTTGTVEIGSAGLGAVGHAISVEQVVALLANFVASAVATGFAGPVFLAAYALNPQAALSAIMSPAILGTVAPAPIGPAPGGDLSATSIQASLQAALAAQLPDPIALGLPQFRPGIGRVGLLL